jgi:hypothetical protein
MAAAEAAAVTADEMERRACMIHLTHGSGAWASILAQRQYPCAVQVSLRSASILAQCKYPCAVQVSLRSTPTAHWAARSAAPALPGRSWCPLHHCHSWWMVSGSWPCSRQWRQGGSRHARYQHRGRQPGGQASVLCPTRLWHSSNITSTSPSRDSASHSTICHSLLQQACTRGCAWWSVWVQEDSRQQAAGSRQQAAGSRQQAAGSRQQAAGSRQQAAGSRQQAAGSREGLGGSSHVCRALLPQPPPPPTTTE